jgi:hypothetical protein
MITIEQFQRELKSRYVPSYYFPRIEPGEIFAYFKPGTIIKERTINTTIPKKEILKLDRPEQKAIWNRLLKIKSFGSMNIAISSVVNDYLAGCVAATLNLAWLRLYPTLDYLWCTTAHKPKERNVQCQALFIRGILSERDRLYSIRDLFDYYPNAVKILIVGGIDGITYFDDYLKMPLHAALHIEGTYEMLPPKPTIKTMPDRDTRIPAFIIKRNVIPRLRVFENKED